jgi:hypothetical protein
MTVLVGENNAGKTTVAEALRLVSIVTERYKALPYRNPPSWIEIPLRMKGCSPSTKGMQIRLETLFHQYQEPPAKITARFGAMKSITIYISSGGQLHACLEHGKGRILSSKAQAAAISFPRVSIMPQVAPLALTERVLDDGYVKGAMSSSLAPLHFRNQLWLFPTLFRKFRSLVEETWPRLQILDLEVLGRIGEKELHLRVRDRDFVAEIGAMGHGLQMWMQTIWFLVRTGEAASAILDEPDVYMHADLQRKLIRFLRSSFRQMILTTHSTEIMAEVDPSEIVVVDRRFAKSKSARNLPAVQKLVDSLGSIHNISLARLWNAREFLLVEGKDLKILKRLQNTLFPESTAPVDTVPHMSIGGWGGWNLALGSSMLLKNAAGDSITVFCLLDSDFHTEGQIKERELEAESKQVQLHVWKKKELENYLLVPSAVQRVISKQAGKRVQLPKEEEIAAKLESIHEELSPEILDALSQELFSAERKLGVGGANKRARAILKEKTNNNCLSDLSPGKSALSRLSEWSQNEFGVGLSVIGLAKELTRAEMDPELVEVLTLIEGGAV